LQPIAVRPFGELYQIIAGERRWHAARSIGLAEVPVLVRDSTDEEMLELALIENIEREDLNAIDRALAYREFCTQFGLKPDQVASRLGEDRTTVVNYLRLLDLSKPIQDLVETGRLSMGHARCLLGITDEPRRLKMAESAVENELSVRALEEVVRREKTRSETSEATTQDAKVPSRAAHLDNLEERFERALGTKVTIREGKRKATGRIIIQYYSLDDFDRVAERLGVAGE
jgi:ParB family chromosome partitioning protein